MSLFEKFEDLNIRIDDDDNKFTMNWDLEGDAFSKKELKIILNTPEFKTLYDENSSKEILAPKLKHLWEQIHLKLIIEVFKI